MFQHFHSFSFFLILDETNWRTNPYNFLLCLRAHWPLKDLTSEVHSEHSINFYILYGGLHGFKRVYLDGLKSFSAGRSSWWLPIHLADESSHRNLTVSTRTASKILRLFSLMLNQALTVDFRQIAYTANFPTLRVVLGILSVTLAVIADLWDMTDSAFGFNEIYSNFTTERCRNLRVF